MTPSGPLRKLDAKVQIKSEKEVILRKLNYSDFLALNNNLTFVTYNGAFIL